MSIIGETLNRLEMDGASPVGHADMTAIPYPEGGRRMGFPLKLLASAMLVAFAGTGLMVWYGNDRLASSGQGVADAGRPATQATRPVDQPPLVTVETTPLSQLPPTEKNSEVAVSEVEQPVREAAKQAIAVGETGTQVEPVRKPMVASAPKAAVVTPPAAKPKPRTVKSDNQAKATPAPPPENTVQANSADTAVEQARLALSRGQYQQALSALESLSPAPERRADYWLVKGSAHLGLGQLDAAANAFEAAQPLAPGNAQIAVQRAILKQEQGDHAGALQILHDATVRHPNVPEVYLNLGYSQQAQGNVRDAGRSFRTFLRVTEGRSLYSAQRKAVNEWLVQFAPNGE